MKTIEINTNLYYDGDNNGIKKYLYPESEHALPTSAFNFYCRADDLNRIADTINDIVAEISEVEIPTELTDFSDFNEFKTDFKTEIINSINNSSSSDDLTNHINKIASSGELGHIKINQIPGIFFINKNNQLTLDTSSFTPIDPGEVDRDLLTQHKQTIASGNVLGHIMATTDDYYTIDDSGYLRINKDKIIGGSSVENIIKSISVNGANIAPDNNKNVDITATTGIMLNEKLFNVDNNGVIDLGEIAQMPGTSANSTGISIGTIFTHISSKAPLGALELSGQTIDCKDNEYTNFYIWLKNNKSSIRVLSDSDWTTENNKYGFCGAFVINEISREIKLPNYNNAFLMGTTDTDNGTPVSAGLPNITGAFNGYTAQSKTNCSGAFISDNATHKGPSTVDSNIEGQNTTTFDASLSNPIYGNSNTVQPPAINVKYYIQAYNCSIDPDIVLNDVLNNKVTGKGIAVNGTKIEPDKSNGLIDITATTRIMLNEKLFDVDKYGVIDLGEYIGSDGTDLTDIYKRLDTLETQINELINTTLPSWGR